MHRQSKTAPQKTTSYAVAEGRGGGSMTNKSAVTTVGCEDAIPGMMALWRAGEDKLEGCAC